MEPRDYVSIVAVVISSFSFAVSFITLRQKQYETQRTLRSQITDVIADLNSVFEESDKLKYESADKPSDPYVVGRRSFLNGQKRFFARQAIYLMGQVPKLVTDFEYLAVADAFSQMGEFKQANAYYEKAIRASKKEPYYRSIALRAYARNLFNQNNVQDGRTAYQDSLNLISLDSDFNFFHAGETYQRWATVEADNSFLNEAKQLFESSRETYEKIQNPGRRKQGLANLEEARKIFFS